jgi:ADP-L-glycero-D-manno-heptose 6-epimerase
MIVVTGGAGFIGSALIWKLNSLGENDILVVDELGHTEKWKNLVPLRFRDFVNKNEFIENLDTHIYKIDSIIHMGANSSTTETDADHLLKNNYEYTKSLALYCINNNKRFIYASSAATYGDGSLGFEDDEKKLHKLRPLNMYGYSKSLFDNWAADNGLLKNITGIKYFNVFGPNEYHKGDMRSVVHKAFEQIRDTGRVKLFKSGNASYKDGEQKRDFVYIKDAVDMTLFFLGNDKGGIYNAGSGIESTWNQLVTAIFTAMGKPVNIDYIDLPGHLSEKYQYYTRAEMTKIKKAGYSNSLHSLEDSVTDYVKEYLLKDKYLGF